MAKKPTIMVSKKADPTEVKVKPSLFKLAVVDFFKRDYGVQLMEPMDLCTTFEYLPLTSIQ